MMKKDERDDFGSILEAASRELAAQRRDDPLGMEAFERSELAIALIASAWGENITARRAAREAGNAAELSKLLEERKKILALREDVYRGNVEVQKRVIRDYASLLVQ